MSEGCGRTVRRSSAHRAPRRCTAVVRGPSAGNIDKALEQYQTALSLAEATDSIGLQCRACCCIGVPRPHGVQGAGRARRVLQASSSAGLGLGAVCEGGTRSDSECQSLCCRTNGTRPHRACGARAPRGIWGGLQRGMGVSGAVNVAGETSRFTLAPEFPTQNPEVSAELAPVAQLHRACKALHTTTFLGVSAEFCHTKRGASTEVPAAKFTTANLTGPATPPPRPCKRVELNSGVCRREGSGTCAWHGRTYVNWIVRDRAWE